MSLGKLLEALEVLAFVLMITLYFWSLSLDLPTGL